MYVEEDTLFWESAFGLQSGFDGMKFEDILKDYDVRFTETPPLEAGRFPAPLRISVNGWSAFWNPPPVSPEGDCGGDGRRPARLCETTQIKEVPGM